MAYGYDEYGNPTTADASAGGSVSTGTPAAGGGAASSGQGAGPTAGAGTQDPGPFGTGQFKPGAFPIDYNAITGGTNPAGDYGLNDVWNNIGGAITSLKPQNYATSAASLGPAPQFGAAQGTAATGTAAQGSAAAWQAAQAQAAQARAAAMGAATGTAAQGGYSLAGNTGISTAGDLAWQRQQQQLANTLANTANGGGISPADLQLQRGSDQGVANQLAILGSQRGNMGNAALATRAAADQGVAAQANLNQQMGIQRAQETLAAQQGLGNVLGTARGQAQNYNLNQANLNQQVQMMNASQMQNYFMQNAQLRQQMGLANLGNIQGANQFNAGNLQQTSLANMQATNQMSALDMAARNQALSESAQMSQGMGLANLNARNQYGLANMGNAQAMTLANMGTQQQQNLANQQLLGQYGLTQAQLQQQANLANQQYAYQGMGQYYNSLLGLTGAATGISESDRAAALAAQQLGVQQNTALQQIQAQAYANSANANANLTGGIIGAASGLVGTGVNAAIAGSGGAPTDGPYSPGWSQPTAVSDENLKSGIRGGNPMLQSFFDQYHEFSSKQAAVDPNAGLSFQLSRSPSGIAGGSHVGSQVGGALGGAAGGAAAGAALGSVVPVIGTAIGGLVGGIAGSSLGSAAGSALDSRGRPIGGGVQASGQQQIGGLSDEPDWSKLREPGMGQFSGGQDDRLAMNDDIASSDDQAKENVVSGNRGMQAFLQQANAQQGAASQHGSQNNAFMQTGQAPSAQVDRQMPAVPPWVTSMGYGAQEAQQAPYFGGPNTDAGILDYGGFGGGGSYGGGVYGGSFSPASMASDATFAPGGISSAGGVMQAPNRFPGIPMNNAPIGNTSAISSYTPTMNRLAGTPMTNAPMGNTSAISGLISRPPTDILGNPIAPIEAPAGPAPIPWQGQAAGTTMSAPMRMSAMSDEGEKQVSASPDETKRMLDHLQAYSYRYKNPEAPGAAPGQRIGVMAQDLEQSPLGSQFVQDTPNGKMVNYGQAAGTMMAALAYHNQRLDAHERMLASMRAGR